MAILVSVLLPVILFLGHISNYPQNKDKLLALSIAQTEMETALQQQLYEDGREILDDRWIIHREIEKRRHLISIEIEVFKTDTSRSIVKLHTERLHYEDKEQFSQVSNEK